MCGHVDHGKSTVVGRLLADTGSLPDGRLEQIRALCERTSKPFEYAFLCDALDDERAQGITIDAARLFFRTHARDYVIIDAPGHIEFLKNMVTGAARADAALLVIDAHEGLQENSRRHGYLLAMLGIRQVGVLVNKMDLVRQSAHVFAALVDECRAFLRDVGIDACAFVPISARTGENIAVHSTLIPWYDGPTVLEMLDDFRLPPAEADLPFRMPVQDVYKFTGHNDDRRIIAGTIASGAVGVGDELVFLPSGKRALVRTLEAFNRAPKTVATAGAAIGFTLHPQVYVARGEMAVRAADPPPHVDGLIRASIFWLGREPLVRGKDYVLKIGSARTTMRVDTISRVIDAATLAPLENRDAVRRHEVADCLLKCQSAVAFDGADRLTETSRLVIVDGYDISGGGIIRGSGTTDVPAPAVEVALPSGEGAPSPPKALWSPAVSPTSSKSRDPHLRSLAETLSWRALETMATTAIVFALTRRVSVSLAVGVAEFASKTVLFSLRVRARNRRLLSSEKTSSGVIWLTGLSGAGKTTLADWVCRDLRARGLSVEQLDGDAIRDVFPQTGYSKADRDAHVKRVGYLASTLEQHGVWVVASFVSPYRESRAFVRNRCRTFIEVHVATPLSVCEQRDVKGLYRKARRGEIPHFTGIDDPYEPPLNADLVIDTSSSSVDQAGRAVMIAVTRRCQLP